MGRTSTPRRTYTRRRSLSHLSVDKRSAVCWRRRKRVVPASACEGQRLGCLTALSERLTINFAGHILLLRLGVRKDLPPSLSCSSIWLCACCLCCGCHGFTAASSLCPARLLPATACDIPPCTAPPSLRFKRVDATDTGSLRSRTRHTPALNAGRTAGAYTRVTFSASVAAISRPCRTLPAADFALAVGAFVLRVPSAAFLRDAGDISPNIHFGRPGRLRGRWKKERDAFRALLGMRLPSAPFSLPCPTIVHRAVYLLISTPSIAWPAPYCCLLPVLL